jgi:tRNA A-37 threonylcarbamoyl transferase component Bud32
VADRAVTVVRLAEGWDRPELRAWCGRLEALAAGAPPEAEIYRGRNLIFRTTVDGREVAVKRFPVESPGKRLIYRFRATKAVHTFDHAVRLAGLGVGTPVPLAAVEVRRRGWPAASYFCSEFIPQFREARVLRFPETPDRARLLGMLGAFVGRLHELGVLHLDLTAGNVLLVPDPRHPQGFEFRLVDINRMRFGRVGTRAGIANLAQLRLNDEGELFAGYCSARALDPVRLRSSYRARVALRSLRQDFKERTRPWRRRIGF